MWRRVKGTGGESILSYCLLLSLVILVVMAAAKKLQPRIDDYFAKIAADISKPFP